MLMVAIVEVVKTLRVDVPNLGARIKEARLTKVQSGVSMTSIAAAAGMSVQNWNRIERERQTLPVETLRLIESVLGVTFDVNFDE